MIGSKITRVSDKLRIAGALFICLACFVTPLSTSLLGLFSALAALSWLLSGGLSELPRQFKTNRSTLIALILFVFMAIAIIWSPAEPLSALNTLKKYRELLLFPVVVSLLSVSERYRAGAELSFIAGCCILMVISYLMFLGIIPEDRYGYSMVFHITHSFFMAVLAFWTLNLAIDSPVYRYMWLIVFTAAAVNILFVAPGRTGMFVFCCLMVLVLYQRLTLSKWLLSVLAFFVLITCAYQVSDNFSNRIQEAVQEIYKYEPGQSRTSVGQRFDWWTTSYQMIKEKPLFGHGTGSFAIVPDNNRQNRGMTPTDNPHNEYLFLTVQVGLVGLILFFSLIFHQLRIAQKLPLQKSYLLQGVILALLTGSLMNSLLFDSQQGHFYLFMSSALMAGPIRNEDGHL